MKIIYIMTGLELGAIHPEQKEAMYALWMPLSDEHLEALGLKRVEEDKK